jgi:protein-S-isoprenylcysteine O-methyltransferase Ste14
MTADRDNPGVIAPPPLLLLAAILLGLLLNWLFPAYVLTLLLSLGARIMIAIILITSGCWLVYTAVHHFRLVGTHVEPWKPSTALVTDGIFGWLRNPMYVGATLFLAGLSILLASDWMLVMAVAFVLVIHFGVVKREEAYLAAKFGEPYRQYMESVPRYGWRM